MTELHLIECGIIERNRPDMLINKEKELALNFLYPFCKARDLNQSKKVKRRGL